MNTTNAAPAPQAPDDLDAFDLVPLTDAQVAEKLDEKLRTMTRLQLEQQRKALAEELGVRPGFIDQEWKKRQPPENGGTAEPTDDLFPDVELWEQPVDGAALLALIVERLKRHVIFTDEQAITVALWITFAWTHDVFTHSPMLLATSAEANSGKTTLLGLVRFLTPHPLFTAEISPAALFRSIEKWKPTIVLDEADVIFKENEALRSVVNSGWTRGLGVIRCTPETFEPQMFSTFGPKAIGMKGKRLPDTTLSRCLIIELTRKLADENAADFSHGDTDDSSTLRRMLARWTADNMDALKGAKPPCSTGSTTGSPTTGGHCSPSPIWSAGSGPSSPARRPSSSARSIKVRSARCRWRTSGRCSRRPVATGCRLRKW